MSALKLLVAVGSLALIGIGLVAGIRVLDDDEPGPWQSWSTLRLEVRSVPLMRGHLELTRSEGEDNGKLSTHATARFLGARVARSRSETVFDASGATRSYVTYSKKRGRRYRFGEHGYSVEKLRSEEGFEAPPDRWKTVSRDEFPYPEGDVRMFDHYGMLLYLREMKLDEPGDEVTLHLATSKGPQAYRVKLGESRTSKRKYRDLRSGENTTVELREFRLRVIPADPDNVDSGFLNMEGETEIWVEADSKTPLEISGKVPRVPGRVYLKLAAIG